MPSTNARPRSSCATPQRFGDERRRDDINDRARARLRRSTWDGAPPVLLKLTSGTTAAPRAIRFRSEQLVADCVQICDTMGITDRDLNFGVIPVSHSYGFSNLITPLLVRGVPMVMSSDRMPRAVLDDLARTKATVFPGMPVFYQAFCEMTEVPPLPDLRLCISAGAPLSLPVAQKFRERFGLAIHSFYGSSECGGICYDRAALADGARVRRSANEGRADRAARSGSAGVPHSRAHRSGRRRLFSGARSREDWATACVRPGRSARRSGDGFRIVGRVSDIINVAGKKVNPAEIEAALLGFSGVREAAVFGVQSARRNEEVAACVVADARRVGSQICSIIAVAG